MTETVEAAFVAHETDRARRWALVCLVAVALAACTSEPVSSRATVPAAASPTVVTANGPSVDVPAATSTTAGAVQQAVVIDVVNQPGSGDFDGAVGDVGHHTCEAAGGRWTSAGSVRNPTDTSADYRVYVSFLDPSGETLALIERDLDDVDPGESQAWSVVFDTSLVEVRCVLRVERRRAG